MNTLKAPREAVLDRLEADGTPAVPTRYSPLGVRLKEKIALNQHPMFLDGAVEVQDEGSQILGHARGAAAHATWWWTSARAPAARRCSSAPR